ncbi:MAG TPA: MotA/TolQ/ExbB proton channel family protein [Opitutaceae bacterium]|jgi:biopolymer transport protein ExbB
MITHSLAFVVLLNKTPMELFASGGFVMWPILLVFTVGLTVIIERIFFLIRENGQREPEVVAKMLECVEKNDIEGALTLGRKSSDTVARIVVYSLGHLESLSNAFFRASGQELARYQQGIATLDTCITAAPLLGLLGTVTGMMRTFGALGASGSDMSAAANTVIGGVAEALIATMCGLGIAIICLFPYNIMNARIEQTKQEIADASHALEILVKKSETSSH